MKKHLMAGSFLTVLLSQNVLADQVIRDDLIVQGSSCIGEDCQVSTTFEFDTLQLVSPTPGISFVDTSSASGFPTNDWRMGVGSEEQGTSYFFIHDSTANLSVLKLSAGENGGVALGAGSTLQDNAVSVGSVNAQRRVTHVADGVNPTDAVNLGQLQQLEQRFEPKVSELELSMAELINCIENLNARLDDLQ